MACVTKIVRSELGQPARSIVSKNVTSETSSASALSSTPDGRPVVIIHPGGAPEWVVKSWIEFLRRKKLKKEERRAKSKELPILDLLRKDLEKVPRKQVSVDDAISELLDSLEPKTATKLIARVESYIS